MDRDSEGISERAKSMARLAALQRLRDEALKNSRTAMLKTIDAMLETETEALRKSDEVDARGSRDASNDSDDGQQKKA